MTDSKNDGTQLMNVVLLAMTCRQNRDGDEKEHEPIEVPHGPHLSKTKTDDGCASRRVASKKVHAM